MADTATLDIPTTTAAAADDAAAVAAVPTPKAEKRKFTFMLHDPSDMSSLGKFVSSDYR